MSVKSGMMGFAAAALLIPALLGLYLSCRRLPSIYDTEARGASTREERNWIGQTGGIVTFGYPFALVLTAYCVKRVILTVIRWPVTAAYFFAVFVAISLPYIWFLCEPDWFNNSCETISCWLWFPIGIWTIPTGSFLYDLISGQTAQPIQRYLFRSLVEIAVWPIWMVTWAWFACLALRWTPLAI